MRTFRRVAVPGDSADTVSALDRPRSYPGAAGHGALHEERDRVHTLRRAAARCDAIDKRRGIIIFARGSEKSWGGGGGETHEWGLVCEYTVITCPFERIIDN